ncbi:hypothetical protein SDC9_59969 [bioreactor metagenome]|uniref:Restriction endonuclease type IV Mrr domain-containing protein n=1 Tax=bioreactor metagenome TaxID=1076179 RepID=A0A644XCY8_9ZZZZ
MKVKSWKIPVHIGVIKKARNEGNKIVVSKNGFTDNAIAYAKRSKIKLEKGNSNHCFANNICSIK